MLKERGETASAMGEIELKKEAAVQGVAGLGKKKIQL